MLKFSVYMKNKSIQEYQRLKCVIISSKKVI